VNVSGPSTKEPALQGSVWGTEGSGAIVKPHWGCAGFPWSSGTCGSPAGHSQEAPPISTATKVEIIPNAALVHLFKDLMENLLRFIQTPLSEHPDCNDNPPMTGSDLTNFIKS
jgi:hypothetical protein